MSINTISSSSQKQISSIDNLTDVSYSSGDLTITSLDTIKADSIEFKNTSDVKLCEMTSDRHLDIQGGLKIGSGGITYGSYSAVLKQLFIRSTYDMTKDYGWWLGTQNFTIDANANRLYFTVQGGGGTDGLSVPAYIDDGYTVGNDQMNFTGQHRCFIQNELTDMIGLIVSSTGKYVNIDNSLSPTINESLPICMLSNLHNDKSVFGVISEKEDTDTTRTYKPSNFVSVIQKKYK